MKRTLKFLSHQEIDFEKWDHCVEATGHPQPYGFSWYLNWLAPQWQAVVLGDYEAVLPVFDRKKYGFNFTTRPFGTQSTGPYSKIPLTSELVKTLVNKAVEHFKYGEFFLAPSTPIPEGWSVNTFSNFALHTLLPHEELSQAYSSQIKRNLKKAKALKLELAQWVTVKEALGLWKLSMQQKTKIHSGELERLGKLFEYCHYQNKGILYAVRDNYNQLCGAQFWITYQGRSSLLLNASTDWGKNHGVSTWLIDTHIASVAGQDHIVDFEGSSIPGLKRFYSGFGAKDEPFYMHVENQLPFPINLMKTKSTR